MSSVDSARPPPHPLPSRASLVQPLEARFCPSLPVSPCYPATLTAFNAVSIGSQGLERHHYG